MPAPTRTNADRAESARRCLDVYDAGDPDDWEANAIDLMTDLLHCIEDQTGTHAEDAHRMAWHHFMAERLEATL